MTTAAVLEVAEYSVLADSREEDDRTASQLRHDLNNALTVVLCNVLLAQRNAAQGEPFASYLAAAEKATRTAVKLAQRTH
jgi:hypothetical protein